MNEKIMEVMSFFKCLASCFSKDGGVQEDVRIRVGEGLKTFREINMMFSGKSVSLSVKRELCKRVLVPMVMYGAETLGMRKDENMS